MPIAPNCNASEDRTMQYTYLPLWTWPFFAFAASETRSLSVRSTGRGLTATDLASSPLRPGFGLRLVLVLLGARAATAFLRVFTFALDFCRPAESRAEPMWSLSLPATAGLRLVASFLQD